MSLILTGNGNQIAMAAPGRPMLLGASSGVVTPIVAAPLSGVPGLAGWWDASLPTGMLSTSGTPLTAFGAPVAAVADKSDATMALNVWHAASAGTRRPVATPRLNGLLGGLGLNTIIPPMLPPSGQQLPLMDPDQGLISAAMAMGSSTAWTLFLVWSRPNWRQSSSAASILLSVGGTSILAGDNNGGGGRLVLFPGTQQTVLTSTLTRRHTHAVILRNTPGTGVDVWLDSTQVATAAPNPMASALSAPLLFLHNGAAAGGAECWFHEAAVWDNALPTSAIDAVLNYEMRWITGPRKGIQILITGQSNSGNGLLDGAWHLLAQGVAWHLGALGFGVVANYGSPPGGATCIHGEAIYPVPALGLSGSFLTNPGDGSDPSTWNLGADGEVSAGLDPGKHRRRGRRGYRRHLLALVRDRQHPPIQRKGDIRGRGPPSVVARARHAEPHRRVLAAGLVVGDPIQLRQQQPRGSDAAGGRGRHGRRLHPECQCGSAADD